MIVFSLAGAPLSVSHDATRAVNLLYCRSPGMNIWSQFVNKLILALRNRIILTTSFSMIEENHVFINVNICKKLNE